MARRSVKMADGTDPSPPADRTSCSTPSPPDKLHVTLTSLARGEVLHRVHASKYQADQFNPGVYGNARFSPIRDEHSKPIPTLYGGTTMACALMEAVFHDVPHTAGFKSFDKGKLVEQVHSTIRVEEELHLADLASVPLRKLGVTRRALIDTEKDQYPASRKWAEAIHRQYPHIQGLSWVSRQDDSARAVVLFGDRIAGGAIRPEGASRSLLDDTDVYDALLDLADRIGVNIVPGKS